MKMNGDGNKYLTMNKRGRHKKKKLIKNSNTNKITKPLIPIRCN